MAVTQHTEETSGAIPRTRERGHLRLVEWPAESPAASSRKPAAPAKRAPLDRLYEGGILLLMAATALAALVSFARL